ncbi:MAG: class I tRNA ligase family protein [Flavobacteriaceae bacterium]|nr:class I tRNA ligase family protein [Flavobacteriaceae bacterium]
MKYNFNEIEAKWQKYWSDNQTFKAHNKSHKPKFYVLDMFPYPSGAGLHVGHPLGYIASDIYARYKRHKGFNVLHPQGYDSFGLPAEQYAIQTGQHPAKTTEENIKTYRRQLDQIGFSFDWSREVRTSSPEYYKWTQWIFIQLFESYYCNDEDKAISISNLIETFNKDGNKNVNAAADENLELFTAKAWNSYSDKQKQEILAKYRLTFLSETEVNWCPQLGTVLANDEIVNGVSERGGFPVVRKKMKQWSMRITAYAQRLLDGLEKIDWPQPLKDSQTNWIGRSQGAMVTFEVMSTFKKEVVKLSYKEIEALKKLRLNLSKAEALLWGKLKIKKGASKFRHKYTLGAFITDFVCVSKKIIIEFTGKVDEKERISFFEAEGFNVVYLNEKEVLKNLDAVVVKIENTMQFPKKIASNKISKDKKTKIDSYKIDVFTTRPDTIFGVSFMTLAPEHELVAKIVTDDRKKEVDNYIEATAKRSERDRMADVKTISGVFTGAYAIHPFNGKKIPIWIGDYVLASYGTGAVMAVPCGDQRDYDFAKHFGIEIPNIFQDIDISEQACEDKTAVIANSDFISGMPAKKAIKRIIFELEEKGIGKGKINYRLRDAVFSRQRYWGEPFPVYYKDGMPQMIDAKFLPIRLPEVEKYLPTKDGKPPLGNATTWAWCTKTNSIVNNNKLNNATVWPLELNTMPGWAGSSWYFNRYMDANNTEAFAGKEALDYWQDVDLYIGGSEHATGHLLYSRFWQKFLFDKSLVPVDEYAKKLINQGMILGTSVFVLRSTIKTNQIFYSENHSEENLALKDPAYQFYSRDIYEKFGKEGIIDVSKKIKEGEYTEVRVPIKYFINGKVDVKNLIKDINFLEYKNSIFHTDGGLWVNGVYKIGNNELSHDFTAREEVEKMSKSKYNVVNPDDICEQYGADTLRLYEMFLGPLVQAKPWNTAGITGVNSFMKKLWKLYIVNDKFTVNDDKATKEELKTLHKTIKKVDEDIADFSFNTSVSSFMIAVNELTALKCNKREILEPLAVLISPYAPHIAEELWNQLGYNESIATVDFPIFDAKYLIESTKTYPISFNGKMRFTMDLSLDLNKEEIEKAVMTHEKTQQQLAGRTPKKVIVIPGKIVNIVG